MKGKLFLALVVAGLVVLAIGGWTVQGLRRATGSGRGPLAQPA